MTVVISRYEPDRAIAWTIDGVAQPPIGHVYGYELEPIEGGTMVTSYYDWSDIHEAYRDASPTTIFPVISETNLRATLGILARVAAPGRGRPGRDDHPKGGVAPEDGYLNGTGSTGRPAAFHAPKPPSMWPTSVNPSVFRVSAASAERSPPAQYTTMRRSNSKNGL